MELLIRPAGAVIAPVQTYTAADRSKAADKSLARSRATLARQLMGQGKIWSWESLNSVTRIPLTYYHPEEFSFEALEEYLKQYCELAGETSAAIVPVEKVKYERSVDGVEFGGFWRKPQQEKAINFIIDRFWEHKTGNADLKGILLPLDPGDGKGVIAAILARYVLEKQVAMPLLNDVLIVTPRSVKQGMVRKLRRVGVPEEEIGASVQVLSYNDLSSKAFKDFFIMYEEKDVSGNTIKRYRFRGKPPELVVIDESQKIKYEKSVAHRRLRAFVDAGSKILFTSATPAVTVQDCMFFALASGLKDMEGQRIGRDSWPALARHIAKGKPTEVNSAAMERFNERFAPAICRPPRDPSKVKVTNLLTIEAMPNDPALRKVYFDAEVDWLKAKERAGEQVSEAGAVMAMFQIMRCAGEYLSVDIFVQRMEQAHLAGYAPVLGICFQSVLREVARKLHNRGVIPRHKLSVIWGGKRDIKLHEVYDDMEFVAVISKGDEMSKDEERKVRLTREYMVQRCRMNLSVEENEARTAELRALGLFKQSENERQQNMDDFQTGVTDACIFTLASGGTGIDLDHQDSRARPRKVFMSTCYYAEEFIQAMGRCKRGATLTDVTQEVIMLAETLAAKHVYPILEHKIKSIRTLAAGHMDLVMVMEKKATFADIAERTGSKAAVAEVVEDIDGVTELQEGIDDDDEEEAQDEAA